MPEQDPYASIAQPIDPYAAIATPLSAGLPAGATGPLPGVPSAPIPAALQGPPAPPPQGNFVQRAADKALAPYTAMEPHGTRHTGNAIADNAITAASNFGAGAIQGATQPIIHPVQTIEGAARMTPVGELADELRGHPTVADETAMSLATHPAETIEQGAGNVVGSSVLGEGAGAVLRNLPEAMQQSGTGIINRTVGSRKADFARGANPGRGYLRARLGPSASMESIADKSDAALGDVRGKLQDVYDQSTASGKLISADKVRNAIDSVIDDARNSASGPGVMTDPQAYSDLRSTFEPSLKSADAKGGFTPQELWEIRKNIDRNLNWGDQSKLNMTKVQQRTSGAIGGILKDEIPETVKLNQTYSDLSNLRRRTAERANTHSSPLTSLASKTALTGAGALMGSATHSPVATAAGAALGAAADSIPVKTTLATGLNAAGNALETVAPVAAQTTTPAALGSVSGNRQIDEVGKADQNNGAASGNNQVVQAQPPTPTLPPPESAKFSKSAWLAKNPKGNIDGAVKRASAKGYKVVD